MNREILIITLLIPLLVGCAETRFKKTGNVLTDLYYSRCVQKEIKAGEENPHEFCECNVSVNPKLSFNKIDDALHACKQLSSLRAIKLEVFKPVCRTFDEDKAPKIGDKVQLYRTYIKNEWVHNVRRDYNGVVWELVDKNRRGVFLKLIKGDFRKLNTGDIKRIGDTAYEHYNAGADLSDGILKSLKVCKY